jgi:PAS domain S-box-containing protein
MMTCYFPENLGEIISKLSMKNLSRPFLFLVECILLVACSCVTAQASDVLQVRGDEYFYPFEFLDTDRRPAGFNVDIIKSVARKMGLAIEIKVGPWHEVRRQVEQGDVDILMGMSKSAERDSLVDFSIPHFVSSFAVFVPQGSSITALDQISGKTVLVQQGGTGHDYLLNLGSVERIVPVKTVADALRGLDEGRGECALLPRLQAMMVIHAQGWEGLHPVGGPVLQRGYCFAVPEGRSDLLALLNEGLSIIKDSGEYDAIYEKWLGVYEPVKKDYQRVIRYAGLGFALLLGCVGIVVLWNWLLKKKVARIFRQLSENRERLRITLDSMWEGVVTTDKDGLITNMNLAAEQLTGWKRMEVNGRHIDEVFTTLDARDRKLLPASVSQVLATGKPLKSPDAILLVARGGSEYHITQTTTPLRDEKGSTHGVVMVFRDVSESYRMRQSLRLSEERFKLAMEAGRDGLWDWNVVTGETYYSPAYAAILGYEGREVPAHVNAWKDFIHPEDREAALQANQECLEGLSDVFSIEFRMRHKNGQWRWILGRGKAVARDENGRAIRMIGTHTDITRIKKTSEALQQQNRRHTTLLSNLNGMAYRCRDDEDWTMEFVSRGCLDLTGYPAADILQNSRLSFNDLIVPEYRETIREACRQKVADHEPFELEYEIQTALGGTRWVWEKGCGIFDHADNLVCIEGFITDISERKQMELALQKRLVALTRPLEQTGEICFEDLFSLEEIQQLQDEFSAATGLASLICKPDGTPLTRPSNFSRLCADVVRKTDKGLANCKRSDALLGRINREGATVLPCKSCGLWDAGASITVGGTHIACWLAGQIRDETQSEETIRAYAREIGADEEDAVRAFYEVPSMSHERFKKITQMLFTLANQLSTTAYINVQQARFIAERDKALENLHRNEENLRVTLDSIGDGVIATDVEGNITRMNQVAEKLTAWQSEEVVGKPLQSVFTIINAHTREPLESPVEKVLETNQIVGLAHYTVLVARDGREYQIADSGAPIRSDGGEILGVVLVFRDVTEERTLQEQLRQSQKMEAIGQLAGGVAHDFNNMLSGIVGATELLKEGGGLGVEDRDRYLDLILQSASRAKDLTWKLLAFGRKEGLVTTDVDLNEIMDDTLAIIGSTMDKRITTTVRKQADHAWVHGNGSALQNAFLNLLLNGIQAMPKGGELHIEIRNIDLDSEYCATSSFELNPGLYVEIRVSDTGIGIPAENVNRLFEPFFTTKPQGKGTGLGLAAVYGTITGNHGEILVASEVGKGTTFQILLPSVEEPQCVQKVQETHMTGSGTILLVDDEESILITEQTLLEDMGYRVICAANGREAVDVFAARHQEIDVVVMDMRMPEMDGHEAFTRMKEVDPACRVIIASGFANMGDGDTKWICELAGFLRKPYRISELSRLVTRVLEE